MLKAPKLLRVWRTAPVCQMKFPEPVQVVGFGPPLSSESPPVFTTAPMVDDPSGVVQRPLCFNGTPAPVAEYVPPTAVVTFAAPAPVLKHTAPVSVDSYMVPQEQFQHHTVEHSIGVMPNYFSQNLGEIGLLKRKNERAMLERQGSYGTTTTATLFCKRRGAEQARCLNTGVSHCTRYPHDLG